MLDVCALLIIHDSFERPQKAEINASEHASVFMGQQTKSCLFSLLKPFTLKSQTLLVCFPLKS